MQSTNLPYNIKCHICYCCRCCKDAFHRIRFDLICYMRRISTIPINSNRLDFCIAQINTFNLNWYQITLSWGFLFHNATTASLRNNCRRQRFPRDSCVSHDDDDGWDACCFVKWITAIQNVLNTPKTIYAARPPLEMINRQGVRRRYSVYFIERRLLNRCMSFLLNDKIIIRQRSRISVPIYINFCMLRFLNVQPIFEKFLKWMKHTQKKKKKKRETVLSLSLSVAQCKWTSEWWERERETCLYAIR